MDKKIVKIPLRDRFRNGGNQRTSILGYLETDEIELSTLAWLLANKIELKLAGEVRLDQHGHYELTEIRFEAIPHERNKK